MVSDFLASLLDAVLLTRDSVAMFLQSVATAADDNDALLVPASATAVAVFLCLSADGDVVSSSSSLDFCPSGDFARPRRYLHAMTGQSKVADCCNYLLLLIIMTVPKWSTIYSYPCEFNTQSSFGMLLTIRSSDCHSETIRFSYHLKILLSEF